MNFRIIHLLASVLFSVSMSAHNTIPLDGQWHFSTDSTSFDAAIYLPGSMASNNLGYEVNLSTPWVGGIADSSFFKAPEYAEFRTPGNFKVPFWLQPVKYYRGGILAPYLYRPIGAANAYLLSWSDVTGKRPFGLILFSLAHAMHSVRPTPMTCPKFYRPASILSPSRWTTRFPKSTPE